MTYYVSTLPAWLGFDTAEYDSSATGNLFSRDKDTPHGHLKNVLIRRQDYNKEPLHPEIPEYPGIECLQIPGSGKAFMTASAPVTGSDSAQRADISYEGQTVCY